MSSTIALSVVFSSFNGEKTLPTMLDAFCSLSPPLGGWQLIAVDNASTDSTRVILESYQDRLPMSILSEPKKGKNNALNKAIEYVEGDLVVFTDDDVVPKQDWLLQLQSCASTNGDFDIFGGDILPRWPIEPPAWMMAGLPLGMLYAVTDAEWMPGEIDVGNVWGPNMAIRKKVFDDGIRYSTDVGPDGSETYMMGSEGDFTRRLGKMGMKAWFCKAAKVEHLIRPNQMTRQWVLNRFFRHGRSSYRYDHQPDSSVPRLYGVERWIYRKLLNEFVAWSYYSLIGQRDAAFRAKCSFNHVRGRFYQAREENKRSLSA